MCIRVTTVPQNYYSSTFALQNERKHFWETMTLLKGWYRIHFGIKNYSAPCWLPIWVPLIGVVFWCPGLFGYWLLTDRAKPAPFSKYCPWLAGFNSHERSLSTPTSPYEQMKPGPLLSRWDICVVLCCTVPVGEIRGPHLCWNSSPHPSWHTRFPMDVYSWYIEYIWTPEFLT